MLGIDDKLLQEGGNETLTDVLNKWGNIIAAKMRKTLEENTSTFGTKKLEQSVLFIPVQVEGNIYTLEFQAEDYFKYIDQGVQGAGGKRKTGINKGQPFKNKAPQSPFKFTTKPPPVKALRDWAYRTNNNPFAIQQVIWKQGIQAKDILEKVLTPDLYDEMFEDIGNVVGKGIEVSISEGFE